MFRFISKIKYEVRPPPWSSIGNIGLTSKTYNCGVSNSMLKIIYKKLKQSRQNKDHQNRVLIHGVVSIAAGGFALPAAATFEREYMRCYQ